MLDPGREFVSPLEVGHGDELYTRWPPARHKGYRVQREQIGRDVLQDQCHTVFRPEKAAFDGKVGLGHHCLTGNRPGASLDHTLK